MSDNLRGALWILLSCVAATVMSVGIRGVAPEIHSIQITFSRFLVGLVLVLPVVLRGGVRGIATQRWKLHLLRGVLGVVAVNCGYYALANLPLVTATVLFFTVPLFVTLLAGPLLRERVGWRRWTATSTGFVGTIIVVGYYPGGFDPAMLTAIGASALFACAMIVGKKLSATERASTILFYFSIIAALASLPPALMVWTTPSASELWLLLLVAVFATARAYCDIRAYAIGEASFVAPFVYVRIILVAVAGYIVFAEIPNPSALFGAAVIMLSTFYIAHRDVRIKAVSGPILQQPDDAVAVPERTRN